MPKQPRIPRRVFEALRGMREGKSLTRATRQAETTGKTTQKYADPAIYKEGSRWKATKNDPLPRPVKAATPFKEAADYQPVVTKTFKDAQLLAEAANAIKSRAETGSHVYAEKYAGKKYKTADGVTHKLPTAEQVDFGLQTGELYFDDFYNE